MCDVFFFEKLDVYALKDEKKAIGIEREIFLKLRLQERKK